MAKEDRNGARVTGDVISTDLDMKAEGYNVAIKVENLSLRDGEIYTEVLPIRIDDKDAFLKAETGKKLSLNGILNTFQTTNGVRTVLQADPATVELAKDDAPYENFAMLTGEIRNKTCRPRNQTQQAWGFVLMKVGEKLFRASVFKNLLVKVDRDVNRGTIMQMGGPLRYREFEVEGVKNRMLEVVAQEDYSKVIRVVEIGEDNVAYQNLMNYSGFDPNAKPTKGKKK